MTKIGELIEALQKKDPKTVVEYIILDCNGKIVALEIKNQSKAFSSLEKLSRMFTAGHE